MLLHRDFYFWDRSLRQVLKSGIQFSCNSFYRWDAALLLLCRSCERFSGAFFWCCFIFFFIPVVNYITNNIEKCRLVIMFAFRSIWYVLSVRWWLDGKMSVWITSHCMGASHVLLNFVPDQLGSFFPKIREFRYFYPSVDLHFFIDESIKQKQSFRSSKKKQVFFKISWTSYWNLRPHLSCKINVVICWR